MKELAIGEEIRIRCVEDKGSNKCCDCCFYGIQCDDIVDLPLCVADQRPDSKNIHYELVETPKPIDLPTDEWICAYSSMFFTGSAVHYVREGMRIMKNWIEKELNPELPKEDTK